MSAATEGPLNAAAVRLVAKDVIALIDAEAAEPFDRDAIRTVPLQVAASELGIPVSRAEKVLPVTTLGPRSRRVTVKALKEYIARNTKAPAIAGK